MATTFACPHCARAVSTGELPAGALTKCPACKQDVHVPLYAAPRLEGALRCPRCTAKVSDAEITCKFCQAKLPGPNTRRVMAVKAADQETSARRLKPLWIALCVLWTGGMAAFLVWYFQLPPNVVPPQDFCKSNLQSLYMVADRCFGMGKALPESKGSRFWIDLAAMEEGASLPSCPAAISRNLGGVVGYRGPTRPYTQIPLDGVLACDFPGAHPEGIGIVLKNGTALFAAQGTPEYDRALRETAD